ncbi:MAG: hypothetical protein IIC21_04050 [Chloroflexi bacterium]|nr:hypothetical protein [Chloroflexota bacterium]
MAGPAESANDDDAPLGWEDVTSEGRQLARSAAAADALHALLREAGRLTLTNIRRVSEFLATSDGVRNALLAALERDAVKGIREALVGCRAPVVAVSPIVGGKAIKGPAADMMQALGLEVSAYQVAELYRDFLDAFILDYADADSLERVQGLGIKAIATDTIMKAMPQKIALARSALRALGVESK